MAHQDDRRAWALQRPSEGKATHEPTPQLNSRRRAACCCCHPRLNPPCANSTLSTNTALVVALSAGPDHLTGYARSNTHRQVSLPATSSSVTVICRLSIFPFTTSWCHCHSSVTSASPRFSA